MQLLRLGLSFSPVGGVIKGAELGTRGHESVWLRVSRARGCWNAFVWAGLCVEPYKFCPLSRKKGHFAHNSPLVVLAEWWKRCFNSPLALGSHEEKSFWMGKQVSPASLEIWEILVPFVTQLEIPSLA